jgi:uncharacterized protein (TIGR03437 family)
VFPSITIPPLGSSVPQPQTGYLSKLSADGSRLLYSTYMGGSRIDLIGGMRRTAEGKLDLLVRLQSPDFPGLPSVHPRCLPALTRSMPAIVRFDPASASISDVTLLTGTSPIATLVMAENPTGPATILTEGPYLSQVPDAIFAKVDPITCITDAMDQTQSGTISPGQLVTMLGYHLGPEMPETYDASASMLPGSLGGATVLVDGVAAPLMYAGDDQINFIVPYEVAGQKTAIVKVTTPSGSTSERTVLVVDLTPAVATDDPPDYPVCDGMMPSNSFSAIVLNPDFSRNSCENPAQPGSSVRLYVNGTGVNHPGSTGANPGADVPLEPVLTVLNGNPIDKAVSVSWAPLGIWEITTRVSANPQGYNLVNFRVNGVNLRKSGSGIAVWVAQ